MVIYLLFRIWKTWELFKWCTCRFCCCSFTVCCVQILWGCNSFLRSCVMRWKILLPSLFIFHYYCIGNCLFYLNRRTRPLYSLRCLTQELKFQNKYLNVNGIFDFFEFLLFFRSYSPFSCFTIFVTLRLRVNLSWKSIHQIEVWD